MCAFFWGWFFLLLVFCTACAAPAQEHADTVLNEALQIRILSVSDSTERVCTIPWEQHMAQAVADRFLLENGLALPDESTLSVQQTGGLVTVDAAGLPDACGADLAGAYCAALAAALVQLPNAEELRISMGGAEQIYEGEAAQTQESESTH